ncbi:MAG: TIGR04282 family arsenosugar biosynthesis glycosyltransferase [Thermodesulfovibrionales bacterium]
MKDRSCIVLFVKCPEKGRVKTRLAAETGEDNALGLYQCFVSDIIATLTEGRYPVRIAFHPPDGQDRIAPWLGDYPSSPQRGEDLGERMLNTFLRLFSEGFSSVLILGSDIPDLPGEVIEEAFDALTEHDTVIGPASDGGYYLIGFTRGSFIPDVFQGIPWSTASVFDLTMAVFQQKGCRVHTLPEWRDVDTMDDLKALWERRKDSGSGNSRTIAFMRDRRIFPEHR